jgi:hypothetical protein
LQVKVLDYADISDILHEIVYKKDNELTKLVKRNDKKGARELAIAVLSLVDKPADKDKRNNQSDDLRLLLRVNKEIAKKVKVINFTRRPF